MTYVTQEARQQLLETLAEASDQLGVALADLGVAYEGLDDHNADRLEEELFRPVQAAYGRSQRVHAAFAGRHGIAAATFEPASPGRASTGARAHIDTAVEAIEDADNILAELQDSMLPVEVGDPELRAGLAEIREGIDHLRSRARELERTLGR